MLLPSKRAIYLSVALLTLMIWLAYQIVTMREMDGFSDSHRREEEMVDISLDGEVGRQGISINFAHLNSVSHRGVWIFIIDSCAQHMLFVRRSNTTVVCTNSWNTFGEHTKVGESYRAAALRGVHEELSLSEADFFLFEQAITNPANQTREFLSLDQESLNRSNREWKETYVGIIKHEKSVILDSREALSMQWIDMQEAQRWISHCDYIPNKLCRTCMDASNISTTHLESGSVIKFRSYGDLIASRIAVVQEFVAEIRATTRIFNESKKCRAYS